MYRKHVTEWIIKTALCMMSGRTEMVDQMCNSVCEAVSTSGDMGILREAWEMQEKKTIERMSVEEEQEEEVGEQEKEGMEKGTDREKEKVETEE